MTKRILLTIALALTLFSGASRVLAQHGGETHAPEAPAADHAASTDHGGDAHAKPPLLPDPTDKQTLLSALWVVIIFVVLLAVLYPTAWKGVLAGLKARENRIRKDIADAEAARARAEATLREYSAQLASAEAKVRDMIAAASAQGEQVAASIRAQAQQESEQIKERANKDIEAAKKQAITEIYDQAALLATSVAEKILRRNLNPEDQKDLVNGSLDQIQTMNRG